MNHPAVEKAADAIYDEFKLDGLNGQLVEWPLPLGMAAIIERETKYSRLVEAAKKSLGLSIFSEVDGRQELRSVLAEIKEG